MIVKACGLTCDNDYGDHVTQQRHPVHISSHRVPPAVRPSAAGSLRLYVRPASPLTSPTAHAASGLSFRPDKMATARTRRLKVAGSSCRDGDRLSASGKPTVGFLTAPVDVFPAFRRSYAADRRRSLRDRRFLRLRCPLTRSPTPYVLATRRRDPTHLPRCYVISGRRCNRPSPYVIHRRRAQYDACMR